MVVATSPGGWKSWHWNDWKDSWNQQEWMRQTREIGEMSRITGMKRDGKGMERDRKGWKRKTFMTFMLFG